MKKLVWVLILGTALSGCVTGRPLREIAMDSNRLVERTANEQTMLNILRARDRMPTHFTSFKELRGEISISGTAGVGGAINDNTLSIADKVFQNAASNTADETTTTVGKAVENFTPSFSATVSAKPSFDLAVYDTQEFQRGILEPIKPGVIEYFLKQGWPENFLTALFVSRVDVTFSRTDDVKPNKKSEYYTVGKFSLKNHPTEKNEYKQSFQDFLIQSRMEPSSSSSDDVKLFKINEFSDNLKLSELAILDGEKFDIAIDGKNAGYVVRKGAKAKTITFDINNEFYCEPYRKTVNPEFDTSSCGAFLLEPSEEKGTQIVYRKLGAADNCDDVETANPACANPMKIERRQHQYVPTTIKVTTDTELRSVDSIIYFLGQYVRYGNCDAKEAASVGSYLLPNEADNALGAKIMCIEEGGAKGALLTVRHRGLTYSLPNPTKKDMHNPDHRGSQAIALVQQLVNLNKSADSLPKSNSIRIEN